MITETPLNAFLKLDVLGRFGANHVLIYRVTETSGDVLMKVLKVLVVKQNTEVLLK